MAVSFQVDNRGLILATLSMPVTVFDAPNFGGRSKILGVGKARFFTPDDFNDVISSVRVSPGFAVILYEHADDGGGFGRSVDLLEDHPDLSQLGFDNQTSYVDVFSTTHGPLVWVRNSLKDGQFVPGHWERQRAAGPPLNSVAIVSPPLPPHTAPVVTTIQVSGADSIITVLGPQSDLDAGLWNQAKRDQAGVIGSDYRGIEPIGSAAFKRVAVEGDLPGMPPLFFWYPQRQPNDHRGAGGYFKRTLVGKVQKVGIADVDPIFRDHDVNVDIVPNDEYQYLLTDAHPRFYTSLMSAEWTLSLHQRGQASCDDADSVAEFTVVEAEILPSRDIHSATAQKLNDLILQHVGRDIGVYGPWIYDRGHCCHAEIHPAEQIWWRDDDLAANRSTYSCNVFCDASERFWWRDQMADGLKLKPWGAPPITGVFAIAFEVDLGVTAATVERRLTFEVTDVDALNVASVPNGHQVHNLIHQGRILVSFIPHNDAFKVSYEHVGAQDDKVRGFLVIETAVGRLTQTGQIPAGQDVDTVDEDLERQAFTKEEGHYMFTVTESIRRGALEGLST